MNTWIYDDGGREAAGLPGKTGDCTVRALAIATGLPYPIAYAVMAGSRFEDQEGMKTLMADLGWSWTPGRGKIHLRSDELPAGRLIVRLTHHVAAVIDGVIHDTYDPSRDGNRMVYGYWKAPELPAAQIAALTASRIADAIAHHTAVVAGMQDYLGVQTVQVCDDKKVNAQPVQAPEQPEQRTGRVTGRDGKTYPRQFDPELPKRIHGLRDAGWTIREISRELGCSVGTVHRVINT